MAAESKAAGVPAFPKPSSITHLHLFAVVNTLLKAPSRGSPLRVLDIGCGDGRLMSYFEQMFAGVTPDRKIEVYGFDVSEHGYGVPEEHQRALAHLSRVRPGIDWATRVRAISVEDPWPYPEDFFDVAVSNQVLEHVADADRFLASLKRVLKPDGISVHLFPLVNYVLEGHVKVPFAHRAHDIRLQQALIEFSNRLGLGRWRRDRNMFDHSDLHEYAASQSYYLNTSTFYRTFGEFHHLCKDNGLGLSYHYTKDYYFGKLRSLAGRQPRLSYRRSTRATWEWICFLILRYVAGVTLVITPLAYDTAGRKHAEKNFLAELAGS